MLVTPARGTRPIACAAHKVQNSGARQCALMQRDVTMGVDQARQDELASRIDDVVVGGFQVHRSAGRTEMADPVSLDGDQGIRGRFTARPIDQGSVFDQRPRLPIVHSSLLHFAELASLYDVPRFDRDGGRVIAEGRGRSDAVGAASWVRQNSMLTRQPIPRLLGRVREAHDISPLPHPAA